MMSIRSRMSRRAASGRIGLIALVALFLPRADAPAQEKAPIPAFDGSRVYRGAGIPDRYQSVAQQIERLEKAATPTYYVVVLRSSGPKDDRSATRDYVNALAEAWRGQAAARRLRFDPERSVIVVVAIENHQVAVHTGQALSKLGLSGDAIVRDLIEPSRFYDLAKAGQYPEAISALLDTTDRWIAKHDATTRRPVAQVGVPAPVVSGGGTSAFSLATGLGLSLLVVVAALIGLLWMLHRRARGRLDQRIKEVRSHATDVMDHLDALKERVKLLPAMDADFKTPMTGETAALYAAVQADVGRLWDRWLSVMDTLDRAQKLALGITSPFKRKSLHDAESLLDQKGLFDEIDAGAQACAASMDRLNQAHESARKELETVRAAKPPLNAQIEAISKVALPIEPYQEELTAITTETDRAAELITADPLGARSALEALKGRAERLFSRVERILELFQEARKLATALDGVRRQVVEHRAKGLRLDEDGGNPNQSLAQADQAYVEAGSALRAGDPDATANGLDTARSMVEQAQGTIAQFRRRPRLLPSRAVGPRASHRAAPRGPAAGGGRPGPAGAGIRPILVRGRGAQPGSGPRRAGDVRRAGRRGRGRRVRRLPAIPGRGRVAPPARAAAAGRAPAHVGTGRSPERADGGARGMPEAARRAGGGEPPRRRLFPAARPDARLHGPGYPRPGAARPGLGPRRLRRASSRLALAARRDLEGP